MTQACCSDIVVLHFCKKYLKVLLESESTVFVLTYYFAKSESHNTQNNLYSFFHICSSSPQENTLKLVKLPFKYST